MTDPAHGEVSPAPASDDGSPAPPREAGTVSIEQVDLTYPDGTPALQGATLRVQAGEFLSIIGPSGCGKSTLLQLVAGIMRPSAGTMEVSGPSGGGDPRIGYVFQEHRLLPWRSVRRNLQLVLPAAGFPRAEWDERIQRYLELVGIPHVADTWPMRLSGGQRQRVAIVRALLINPSIVLMDEPFSALDEVTGQVLREELTRIWQETGQTILFVTHSIREAVFLSDRIVVLSRGPGRVLEEVTVDVARPRAIESPEVVSLEQRLAQSARAQWGADTDTLQEPT